ncbi:MAG TPA: hypothetical protein VF240_03930 [Pyrinomonadaceae bacterium]
MAQTATATKIDDYTQTTGGATKDVVESTARGLDQTTKQATGISLFHLLTLGSIGASIALYIAGKKDAAIFVGLWPPTFQALKAVADTNKEDKK